MKVLLWILIKVFCIGNVYIINIQLVLVILVRKNEYDERTNATLLVILAKHDVKVGFIMMGVIWSNLRPLAFNAKKTLNRSNMCQIYIIGSLQINYVTLSVCTSGVTRAPQHNLTSVEATQVWKIQHSVGENPSLSRTRICNSKYLSTRSTQHYCVHEIGLVCPMKPTLLFQVPKLCDPCLARHAQLMPSTFSNQSEYQTIH